MRILQLTNTYLPHVGGVARSISAFESEYRRLGHEVLTIAPEFETPVDDAPYVIRVPAIKKFNGSDFSVPMPIPGLITAAVSDFKPEVVHSHHPFLMGGTAIRIARSRNLPLVFTHHTMYDQYLHYVSGETNLLTQFIVSLTVGYANLCDTVIAPSRSVADLLAERGVETPVQVIPTGVDCERFSQGDGVAARKRYGVPGDAFVVGHVGRLAPEKNLPFLGEAVATFLQRNPRAHFLVVGAGPSQEAIEAAHQGSDLAARLHMTGVLEGQSLIDAYHAMDLFAFSSVSETQGMVIAEAMAAGLPVVALDGPGVREVVADRVNGRLLDDNDVASFAQALEWVAGLSESARRPLHQAALATADRLSMRRTAQQSLDLYDRLQTRVRRTRPSRGTTWGKAKRRIQAEWKLLTNVAHAAGTALEVPVLEEAEALESKS